MTATVEDGDDDDDDYDSDDDDLYDETNLEAYTTPIDDDGGEGGVDEYHVFKATLEGVQSNDGDWYAALTGGLTQEQAKGIQDIFTLYQQRKAARESKSIEKAGGYNFTQNTQVCVWRAGGGGPSVLPDGLKRNQIGLFFEKSTGQKKK